MCSVLLISLSQQEATCGNRLWGLNRELVTVAEDDRLGVLAR